MQQDNIHSGTTNPLNDVISSSLNLPRLSGSKMVSNNKRLLLSFNYLYVVFLGKDDFVLTATKIGGTKVWFSFELTIMNNVDMFW